MSTAEKKRRGRRRGGGLRKHQEIENVKVEESFTLHHGPTGKSGEGCYVSATTSNNKRYYGVMVDQSALKEASSLWFQDQADSLELNRRMKLILDKEKEEEAKQAEEGDDSQPNKRQKVEEKTELPPSAKNQSVQKFKYVRSTSSSLSDYRQLLATFLNVNEASEGDSAKRERILNACESGGDFVGPDYYQYEVPPATLTSQIEKAESNEGWRASMSLSTFLNDTQLPPFYPLSNLQSGNNRVLGMLNMKRDNSGNVVWDKNSTTNAEAEAALLAGGTRLQSVPMQTRSGEYYKIGVIGGGIAGLSCCLELLTLLKNEGIKAKVTLLEARSRVGGRLFTEKFVSPKDGSTVPMELGASWIHGIDHNPLAAMCRRANIDFVTASEEVVMIDEKAKTVDEKMDERMGQLFDDLLDHAAEDCWTPSDAGSQQKAVKWYASVFAKPKDEKSESEKVPQPTGVPLHRKSTDQTVDYEIGKAISKHKLREFSKLGSAEHRMLLWNTKNVEYALGSNLADLSMKFWDSDERHAFEGDHVMLKQGYGAAVDYMLETLQAQSEYFELVKDYPVGKVEYARKSATHQYGGDSFGTSRKLVEMSDTCSVSKQDGTDTKYFDFLICAAPLGVLKEATQYPSLDGSATTLSFQPALPFSKIDAITNVGFGLLNKVYLCFDSAFWRSKGLFESRDQCLFGNVTGKHPHHYMFFDVGKIIGDKGDDSPAMLMSLISGKEAVKCEHLSDEDLVSEVMESLQIMFSNQTLPKPKFHRITRWGKDKFSRGSYTFLPPGATDQDFQSLQSPINGNGDSLWVEGNETMRVFFAGEHTTALHPSMAHGAMLSGQRAAAEVISTILFKSDSEKEIDRLIPEPLFRYKNPLAELKCSLCHKDGGTIREGRLVAFKRGSRQVLVHNNCAENCPEVEVVDSKWKHVIKAVNRGKALNCDICKKNGATVGCTGENCFRIFHFACAEDTGWRFDRDSKVFYCDLHRPPPESTDQCDRISLEFYLRKNSSSPVVCAFCQKGNSAVSSSDLLAFQCGTRRICAHENCIKLTTIIDTSEAEHSRMGKEYRNVFRAFDMAKTCTCCERGGATITCSEVSCASIYHYGCAIESGCSFQNKKPFLCKLHRNRNLKPAFKEVQPAEEQDVDPNNFRHDLFKPITSASGQERVSLPSNEGMGFTVPVINSSENTIEISDDSSDASESSTEEELDPQVVMNARLSCEATDPRHMVRLKRPLSDSKWDMSLRVDGKDQSHYLVVASVSDTGYSNGLKVGDKIVSIDGKKIGTCDIRCFEDVLVQLQKELSLEVEVARPAH
ncbi:unnamed protein product [Cylindrotheca closterium]|uniref:Amine oxidase n=1 Tax=Cylindrotheca closterium TaxID=2856 RepID=A0AAD2CV50_9STRA|nr:unnamed protein product [Cylindrotheca closterium]